MKYFIFFSVFFSNITLACTFPPDQGPPKSDAEYMQRLEQFIHESDYIFVGFVKKHEWKPNPAYKGKPTEYNEIVVETQFKGKVDDVVKFWQRNNCFQTFKVGEKLLFFGEEDTISGPQFSILGGTISETKANEIGVFTKLPQPKLPQPNPAEEN